MRICDRCEQRATDDLVICGYRLELDGEPFDRDGNVAEDTAQIDLCDECSNHFINCISAAVAAALNTGNRDKEPTDDVL